MRTVLAAIDASPAAQPVLDTALGMASLTDATVEAVHVREMATSTSQAIASRRGVPIREVEGDVETCLLRELNRDEVILGVVGARGTPTGRRPVGHTALQLLRRTAKPLVVVPPETMDATSGSPHRLLIAVEGTEESARPVTDRLAPLLGGNAELVAVHVFTTATAPPMIDHPEWGLEAWGAEFLARYCPEASQIDLRTGPVGGRVLDAAADAAADLIVLSWSQDTSPGHAVVVQHVLERSPVPILLLPVDGRHATEDDDVGVRRRPR
ncbi:MAG TPA: universal stress protein [Acidimicrobiales bacterium]|nr:universal stress protein [Acidimicrobiales bacterium]